MDHPALWSDRAGAVPDLDVLRAYKARQTSQMVSLSGACRTGRWRPGPPQPNSERRLRACS